LAQLPFVPPVLLAEHAWHVPLQTALQQKPSTQLPLWHWLARVQAVPFAASHAPAPLHSVAHSLSGSVFTVTLPQVPFDPPVFAAEHAWHVPLQTALQQKPSTQLPLWHWFCAVHADPCASLGTHWPAPLQ
jgi:hypothetical protein